MPLILGTNSIKDTGYDVGNSLRFNDDSSDHLSQSLSSSFKSTWTWSGWVKRANLTSSGFFGNQRTDNNINSRFKLFFNSSNQIQWEIKDSTGNDDSALKTNRLFRDVSAWYHIVFIYDTTNGTAGDRLQLYVNGTRETSFATEDQAGSNFGSLWSSDVKHYVGVANGNSGLDHYFDGYMAEVVFIDGSAVAHTEFGEFDEDTGIWKPKDVSGLTFGSDGYYLDFENSGSLGADVSGNGNNFTVNNLTSIDQTTDTCTNNFATMNPLANTSGSQTFAQGNLNVDFPAGNDGRMYSTIGFSSGKFYAEFKIHSFTADRAHAVVLYTDITSTGLFLSFCKTGNANTITAFGSAVQSSLASFSAGDIIGMAVDADNGTVDFTRNGSAYGSQVTGLSSNFSGKDLFFGFFGEGHPSLTRVFNASVNFGGAQTSAFTISSGNSDANGHGNFEHSVPSGYFSLNTKNLAEYG